MPEKSLTIRGVEWRYVTGGRGEKTVLLLHGAAGGAETMRWLAEAFGDEYRTVAPTMADVSTLDEVCDAASAILDREHVGRAVVFGASFGGLVAQAFFHRRRAQVEDLVLVSTLPPDRQAGARTRLTTRLLRLLPFSLTRKLLFGGGLTKRAFLSRMALSVDFNLNETYPPEAQADWPGRVLIVESNDDPAINEAERRRLRASYPRALVCALAGAGHADPLLRLEELAGVVKAFLKDDYSSPSDIFDECADAFTTEAQRHC